MVTQRDYDIINFISEYKIASTDTIQHFFFPSKRMAQNRLRILTQKKLVKRSRDTINSQYAYYISKPKQLRHSLLCTEFYRELSKACKVAFFRIEPTIANIRPDAIFGFSCNNNDFVGILEVEISHKGFDYLKYSTDIFDNVLPTKPIIFAVGNNIKPCPKDFPFRFKIINTNLNGMRSAIR